MKKLFLLCLFLLFSIRLFANNIISIPYMNKPKIDGIIEEAEWNATKITGFHKLGGHSQENDKTIVYMGYDDENLYYAFKCYSTNKPKGLAYREMKNYWEDDAIELFLTPDTSQKIYYQIIINAYGGTVSLSNTAVGNSLSGSEKVEMNYIHKTHINSAFDEIGAKSEDLYWEGEVSIPWKNFEMNPKEGDEITFLLGREKVADGIGNSNFGYIYKSFYESYNYSKGIFTKDSPIIEMNHSKIMGGDFNIINPTDKEITLKINNKVLKYNKEFKNIDDKIKLKPKETKSYIINDFPKGIYDLISSISYNDKVLFQIENEILNTEVFKYNYDKEKDLLTFDLDFDGINYEGYPFVELRLMKGNYMVHGYMITINGIKKSDHYEIDTKDLKGEYEIVFHIKGVYEENIKISF